MNRKSTIKHRLTKNWQLHEVIPKELYHNYPVSYLLRLIDNRIINAAQGLCDVFGAAVCNDWIAGGARNESGLRIPEHDNFSITSQHTYGRALDLVFKQYTAFEVRNYIRKHWLELGIYGIETNVNWVHIDVRPIHGRLIHLHQFKPAV